MTSQERMELVEWLRNSPSTEWNGQMLVKAADQIEALMREELSHLQAFAQIAVVISKVANS